MADARRFFLGYQNNINHHVQFTVLERLVRLVIMKRLPTIAHCFRRGELFFSYF